MTVPTPTTCTIPKATRPEYNRCDACGRNAHKVAVRNADGHVYGYCPACWTGGKYPRSAIRDHLPDGAMVVYDRRGQARGQS